MFPFVLFIFIQINWMNYCLDFSSCALYVRLHLEICCAFFYIHLQLEICIDFPFKVSFPFWLPTLPPFELLHRAFWWRYRSKRMSGHAYYVAVLMYCSRFIAFILLFGFWWFSALFKPWFQQLHWWAIVYKIVLFMFFFSCISWNVLVSVPSVGICL